MQTPDTGLQPWRSRQQRGFILASSQPIRIMHVVQSLDVGGLENGVVNLLNRLQGEDFDHVICCLTHAGKLAGRIQATNVEIVEVGLRADKFRFPIVTLQRVMRRFAPDILHTRGWSTVDAIFAARCAGVARVIHGEHGREASDPGGLNRKRNLIRRCFSPLVDQFITVSEDLRLWLIERVGIPTRKVRTIHNGVDTEKFAPHWLNQDAACSWQKAAGRGQGAEGSSKRAESMEQRAGSRGQKAAGREQRAEGSGQRAEGKQQTAQPEPDADFAERKAGTGEHLARITTGTNYPSSELAALRRELGLPIDGILFGTVGRLDPVKDHRTLLHAFAPIARLDCPAYLLIVGDGPMRDDIGALVAELGIGNKVFLLGERQDIPKLLKALDVFTLTSIAEGISNTVLEAMASGLPVVATRVGGNPELVEHGRTGQLIASRDVPGLTSALEAYLNDSSLQQEHGRAGRARAVEHFSLDRMAQQYADLYRSMAGHDARAVSKAQTA
jgi:glycosyltransferase involved in cell wall biosynthesis